MFKVALFQNRHNVLNNIPLIHLNAIFTESQVKLKLKTENLVTVLVLKGQTMSILLWV